MKRHTAARLPVRTHWFTWLTSVAGSGLRTTSTLPTPMVTDFCVYPAALTVNVSPWPTPSPRAVRQELGHYPDGAVRLQQPPEVTELLDDEIGADRARA